MQYIGTMFIFPLKTFAGIKKKVVPLRRIYGIHKKNNSIITNFKSF